MSEAVSTSQNPNICPQCASLFDDIQDNTIIESAIPWEARQEGSAQAETENPPATPEEENTPRQSRESAKRNR